MLAREPCSVILAGKRGSRRPSTTSFSEIVVVTETSYQMLDVLAFCNRDRVLTSFNNDNSVYFSGEKSTMKSSGVSNYFLTIREKTLNQISYS